MKDAISSDDEDDKSEDDDTDDGTIDDETDGYALPHLQNRSARHGVGFYLNAPQASLDAD